MMQDCTKSCFPTGVEGVGASSPRLVTVGVLPGRCFCTTLEVETSGEASEAGVKLGSVAIVLPLVLRKAGGRCRRKGRLTPRRRRMRCECSRVDRGVSGSFPRNICLSPQISESVPGRIAKASVLLKCGKFPNEATPLGLLSAPRSSALKG